MSKIPTAEEFYKQTTGCVMNHRDIKITMIEFAKLHVEACKQEIIKEIHPSVGVYKLKDDELILNTYPLENVK